jgi:ubiquinone/menaquinone biosynthesis C-methylase UbiE
MKSTLFSHSKIYAKYRIVYPNSLFDYLRSLVSSNSLAWDVGTGTGQAAVTLSSHFQRVVGSDINANQISQYPQNIENVDFHVSNSFELRKIESELGLKGNSVDLVLVAQAVHWFPLNEFHLAVKHVLKDKGIYAILTYVLPNISPSVDSVLRKYHDEVLSEFWAEENKKYVHTMYKTIDFPFDDEIRNIPEFSSRGTWNLEQLFGYLDSWSATQVAAKKLGRQPILDDPILLKQFTDAWEDDPNASKEFSYPLYLRIARHHRI